MNNLRSSGKILRGFKSHPPAPPMEKCSIRAIDRHKTREIARSPFSKTSEVTFDNIESGFWHHSWLHVNHVATSRKTTYKNTPTPPKQTNKHKHPQKHKPKHKQNTHLNSTKNFSHTHTKPISPNDIHIKQSLNKNPLSS